LVFAIAVATAAACSSSSSSSSSSPSSPPSGESVFGAIVPYGQNEASNAWSAIVGASQMDYEAQSSSSMANVGVAQAFSYHVARPPSSAASFCSSVPRFASVTSLEQGRSHVHHV
jgi:hypothetical protein